MKSKMTTPQLISEGCIVGPLRILNRAITKMYDDAFRSLGIKTSQLNILVVIGTTSESTPPAEICRRLKLDVSTVSRNVERMRARGWIDSFEDEQDGRARCYSLSAEGRQLLEKAKPAWERTQKEVTELLGASCVSALSRAMEKVRG